MTINVTHLVRVSNAKYNGYIRRFTGEKGLNEALDYETFVFNAVLRYGETGDATHLNNCVVGARNMGKVRVTTKVLKLFSAHKWDAKARKFDGKAEQKGRLRRIRRMGEDAIAMEIAGVLEDIDATNKAREKEFDIEAYAATVAKKILTNEGNVLDFERALERKLTELRDAA